VLIELDGVRFLTDPLLRKRMGHLWRVTSAPATAADVDAVLISHAHYDHLDLPSLRRLDRSCLVVVPRGARRLLSKQGFRRVVELDRGERVQVESVTVAATRAEHDGRRSPFGIAPPALGFVLSGSGRVYFAGDTDLFEGMRELSPDLDVALLPVAGWGPRLPPGHLDARRAAQALALLRPRVAIPIHWGTYRRIGLGRDPSVLREPAETFVREAAELAPGVNVCVLEPGGSLEVSAASSTLGDAEGGFGVHRSTGEG
jgi:L-ascorbate metabolism protein UlaG (beta-lactamase superfamily)